MDKYRLYTAALQQPRLEAQFVYSLTNGPLLREDFCGTGAISCEWIKLSTKNRAIAIDIDAAAIRRGRQYLEEESSQEMPQRLEFILDDSVTRSTPDVDAVLVPNSSMFLITERETLCQYLVNRLQDLAKNGVIVIDIFGGPEVYGNGRDQVKYSEGYCVWEQRDFDPRTNELIADVQFESPEGEMVQTAFTYPMRLWSTPELVDALQDAGFTALEVRMGGTRYDVMRGLNLSQTEVAAMGQWEACIIGRKPYG